MYNGSNCLTFIFAPRGVASSTAHEIGVIIGVGPTEHLEYGVRI